MHNQFASQKKAFPLAGTRCRYAGGSTPLKKGEDRAPTLWYHLNKTQLSDVSCFAFRRCRRLISPFTAVTMNCAFVSPSSRLLSISVTTSCGNLALSCCDFLLIEPVAITESPYVRCDSVYAKKMTIKDLKCDSLDSRFNLQGAIHLVNAKPGCALTLTGPLTTADSLIIEAAMQNHTTPLTGRNSFTPNKFTWRFLAFSRTDSKAKPCRMSVEAYTEQEARQVLAPQFILSFAARLPVQEVSHA